MHRSRHRATALLAVIVVVALTTAVAARPPPQPLCEVCSDEVLSEETVDRSAVTVRIDGNGTGHWSVTLELRENATLESDSIRATAAPALRGHRDESEPLNLSVAVSDDRIQFNYEVPRMGHRSVGDALVVDYFYSHGDPGRWYGINADRVVVTGPEGSTLVSEPRWISSNETALVLTGEYGDAHERTLSEMYLGFASDDGVSGKLAVTFGVGIDRARSKLDSVPDGALLPTAVLVGFLLGLYRLGDTLAARSRLQRLGGVLGLAAAFTLLSVGAAAVLGEGIDSIGDAGMVFLFVGVFISGPWLAGIALATSIQYALADERYGPTITTGRVVDAAAVLSVIALAGGFLAAGAPREVALYYGLGVELLVPLLFLPLALTDRTLNRALLAGTIVVSPILIELGLGPAVGGLSGRYLPVLYVPWAVVAGTIGSLTYAYGLQSKSGEPAV